MRIRYCDIMTTRSPLGNLGVRAACHHWSALTEITFLLVFYLMVSLHHGSYAAPPANPPDSRASACFLVTLGGRRAGYLPFGMRRPAEHICVVAASNSSQPEVAR